MTSNDTVARVICAPRAPSSACLCLCPQYVTSQVVYLAAMRLLIAFAHVIILYWALRTKPRLPSGVLVDTLDVVNAIRHALAAACSSVCPEGAVYHGRSSHTVRRILRWPSAIKAVTQSTTFVVSSAFTLTSSRFTRTIPLHMRCTCSHATSLHFTSSTAHVYANSLVLVCVDVYAKLFSFGGGGPLHLTP